MNKTLLTAVTLSLLTSIASAHKFPLEQGVQDSETIRMEIVENVVNPCYVNIAWGTGAEATMKLGEKEVLAKMKLDGHDEIEATVRSITRTVKELPHPSSRMAIYMHAVEKCVAGSNNDNIGEVVKQDITDIPEEKDFSEQVHVELPSPADWVENEVIDNIYRPCVTAFVKKYAPDTSYEARQRLLDVVIKGYDEAVKKISELIRTKYADVTSAEVRNKAYAAGRITCENQLSEPESKEKIYDLLRLL